MDINKLIENIFSHLLPYLVKKFSILWVVIFSCSTVISIMTLLYSPKLKLAEDALNFNIYSTPSLPSSSAAAQASMMKNNQSIEVYIVWGSHIHETSSTGLEPLFSSGRADDQTIDELLDRDMEMNPFENFHLMYQMCQSVKVSIAADTSDERLFKRLYCFGDLLERFLIRSLQPRQLAYSSMSIYQNYCDPAIKPSPFERFVKNRKNPSGALRQDDKNLFIDCIKWWSLNLNTRNNVVYGPLFLANRVLPSVYLIKLESNLKFSQDFDQMQENFKM